MGDRHRPRGKGTLKKSSYWNQAWSNARRRVPKPKKAHLLSTILSNLTFIRNSGMAK